ncbi:MAG TPA: histidine kinase, partial [Candidatus Polarisedimenticolia bacterium]|nr:histidine kinase [Candidatus Polarisedimenticolia bacterium]
MNAVYVPQSRAERLIALGRVALAGASLFAVWFDPTQPAKYANIAYSLLAAYVGYAALLAALSARAAAPRGAGRVITQVFDLVFFTTFIYFTAGPSSPFIAYFVFSLVCGTVRWGWRGALWTAVAAVLAFLGIGAYFAYVVRDPSFEFNAFIIHSVYLGVVAVLLGYLGAHEERSRREISQLAAWPRAEPRDLEPLLRELLLHARGVLGAPGAFLAWTDREEPWLYVASWRQGEFELARLAPGTLEPLVADTLAQEAFLCADLRSPGPLVVRVPESIPSRWYGSPMHSDLVERFDMTSVVAAPLPGETLQGWLFLTDKRVVTLDDLGLAKIVAGIVASRLDLQYLLQRLRETAATEERIRLARDLHDGVMQSLTGIALRLAALQRQVGDQPGEAVQSIEEIRGLIALEQQDLRFFIDELKPAPAASASAQPTLGVRLEDLRSRVEREWNLRMELPRPEAWPAVRDGLGRDIYLIVREAVVNAVRHGEARRVAVEARLMDHSWL